MNKKIARMLEPNLRLYLVMMLVFSVGTFFAGAPDWAVAEVLVTVLLFLYYRYTNRKRRDKILQYIDTMTGSVEKAGSNTLLQSPLPTMVFRPDSKEMVWGNDKFLELVGKDEKVFENNMETVMPGFDYHWLLEGKSENPEIAELGGRHYRVYGSLSYASASKAGGRSGAQSLLATTYWIDTTECDELRLSSEAGRPVVAIIYHDNYEDVMKACSESGQSAVQAAIHEKIGHWLQGTDSLLMRCARDRFLLVIEQQHYKELEGARFTVLEQVHDVRVEGGVIPTLSIGVGKDAPNFEALLKNAQLSLEMALSRGGDQAVVKNSVNFEFFGGRSKTSEKRTKVKSRVMANALRELMGGARNVYIMGHQHADMDAIGAAAGIMCIARHLGKKAHIVIDGDRSAAGMMLEHLREHEEYRGVFMTGSEAFLRSEAGSLLVVVDTNRPDIVESPQLLEACTRVAVIDHHRRAASYIENAALNFHEPYASSACELVTELLQYLVEPGDLLRAEAEALLAGIVLDTKNFRQRTGGRTFEAAAFLRRAGADTSEVNRMFQGDLDDMVARFDIIRHAEMYRENVAIAEVDEEAERIVAAQAADELMNLRGVEAAFVVFRERNGVGLCGRSAGEVNVQVILESLGGGGNATMAGGYVENGGITDVADQLRSSVDRYFED